MKKRDWHDKYLPRFNFDLPDENNAYQLAAGQWKFDFEKMTKAQISKQLDIFKIPGLCAEIFGFGENEGVLEIGPGEGYLSYGLEKAGYRNILSLENNVSGFQRCLILKNNLDLATKYMLGDAVKYVNSTQQKFFLIFASGILYHLLDPLHFLDSCSRLSRYMYIWTGYYDKEILSRDDFERISFARGKTIRTIYEENEYTYYTRPYTEDIVSDPKYAGGNREYSCWMSLEDIHRALESFGYEIIKEVLDGSLSFPATNLFLRNRRFDGVRILPWRKDNVKDAVFCDRFFKLPSILDDWIRPFRTIEGMNILDFGCGTGVTLLGTTLKYGPARSIGVDIMPDMEQLPELAKVHLDLESLPDTLSLHRITPGGLPDEATDLDLVYAWSVFEHVDRSLLDTVLRGIHERMNSGGFLFIQIAPLYYSAEGSHLTHKVAEPWGHLWMEPDAYERRLRNACKSDEEFDVLISMYRTLNRITAPECAAEVRHAGFDILREYTSENTAYADVAPPLHVQLSHDESILRTEQVVLLAVKQEARQVANGAS